MEVDDVPYREISRNARKSRRDRLCDICSKTIKKGETYQHIRGVSDGEFGIWNIHMLGGCE